MKTQLLVAFCFCTLMVSALIAYGLITLLTPKERPGLCEYISPRTITTRVMGVEGPAVNEGRSVTELAQRCVKGASLISVYAYRYFDPMDSKGDVDSSRTRIISLNGLEQNRGRGSVTTEAQVQLPPEVTSGLWRLSGVDTSISTGEVRTWFSETFKVIGTER